MTLDFLSAYYRCDDVRNWNPPPVDSEDREKMPSEAFLDPANRKYPYRYKNAKGEWIISEKALLSARRLAAVHDRAVFDKTTPLLNEIRKERGEEPLNTDDEDDSKILGNEEMAIRELCKNIGDEAQAISDYTKGIALVTDKKVQSIFAEIRNDELGHLQKLTVALSEVLNGKEPTVAANMDTDGGGGDE